jgi:hypothetical protein
VVLAAEPPTDADGLTATPFASHIVVLPYRSGGQRQHATTRVYQPNSLRHQTWADERSP